MCQETSEVLLSLQGEGPGTFSQNELLRSLVGRSTHPHRACSVARGLTFRAAG